MSSQLDNAIKWLSEMHITLSEQTTDVARDHVQQRIDIVESLIEESERVHELEHILDQDSRQAEIESLHVENLRYREVLRSVLNNDETYITNEEIILEELERVSE